VGHRVKQWGGKNFLPNNFSPQITPSSQTHYTNKLHQNEEKKRPQIFARAKALEKIRPTICPAAADLTHLYLQNLRRSTESGKSSCVWGVFRP